MPQSCPKCQMVLAEPANFCVFCGHDLRREDGGFHFIPPDPLVGQIVADRYRILELVGRGGMGVVYKVEHIRMGKLMAVKLLHGELSRDREVVRRFKREAMAVSQLSNPNTVQVFDFGRSEGLMYLVMEFIEGVELARWVRDNGPMPFTSCAAVLVPVCLSLAEAHEKGIIHRDLKPENVLIRERHDGSFRVKVLDFGLAKLREAEERADTTMQGVLVGTPHYMSPEQIRGEAIDERSDIYSLGAMMHKVLTGEPPFKAPTPVAVLTRHLNEDALSMRERYPSLNIPVEMDQLVLKCLAKRPKHRFQSVDEIRDELYQILMDAGAPELIPSDSNITPRSKVIGTDASEAATSPAIPKGALRVGNRLIQISSRNEFDRFERRLLRRRILGWASALFCLLVLIGLGAWYLMLDSDLAIARQFRSRFALVDRVEREPNDQPAEANLILSEIPVTGIVGRRVSVTESDRDWFVIRNVAGREHALRATLDPIPHMNLVLQAVVFDRGTPRTIAESNSGGEGEGETISGVLVENPDIYILVREEWLLGRPPTENVSDSYRLQVLLIDPSSLAVDDPAALSEELSAPSAEAPTAPPDDASPTP